MPLVPPVWQDFTIRFTLNFARRIDYVEIVHYSDDFTAMQCCHCIDGKKAMEITLDYNDLHGDNIPFRFSAPETTTHSRDWLENEAFAVLRTVLSVQYFLLMHRPEVVPVLLEPSGRKKSARSTHASPAPKKLKPAVRQYIRLSAEDKPPIQRTYRAVTWSVRGHYRRIRTRDGEQKTVYVRPHTASHFGGKRKLISPGIRVEAKPEEDQNA